jgi:hypothetical protein
VNASVVSVFERITIDPASLLILIILDM